MKIVISILFSAWYSWLKIEGFCTESDSFSFRRRGYFFNETLGTEVDYRDYYDRQIECLGISQSMNLTIENRSGQSIDKFTIRNSNFSTLPTLFLSEFPYVKKLCLRNNHIKTIKLGAFDKPYELQYLYLDENEIETIPVNLFTHTNTDRLTLLSLQSNNITTIDVQFFQNFRHSDFSLDLSANPIKRFDNFDRSTVHLPTLVLNNMSVEEFTYDFRDTKLNTLNMSHCSRLKTVDFSKIPGVKIANFSHNSISTFANRTKLFQGTHELRELYLSHNSLQSIPIDSFRNLTSLMVLDLSANQIRQFSIGTFSKLTNLQYLYVQHNQLTSIFELNPLVGLVGLYLDHNAINFNLEEVKLHFRHLREMSFSHNNPWSCRNLVKFYHELKTSGVRVLDGDEFDVENLHGISCSSEDPKTAPDGDGAGVTTPAKYADDGDRIGQFYNVDFFRTKFYKYFQEDYANSNFFSYLRNYKFVIGNDNVSNLTESNKAEKFTSLMAVKPENYSGFLTIIVILLVIMIAFFGCIVIIVYKMFAKDLVRNNHEAISLQENLIA